MKNKEIDFEHQEYLKIEIKKGDEQMQLNEIDYTCYCCDKQIEEGKAYYNFGGMEDICIDCEEGFIEENFKRRANNVF